MTEDAEPRPVPEAGAPSRRRRRPHAPPVDPVGGGAGRPPRDSGGRPTQRWQRWRSDLVRSVGLTPAFRVYLFVASILAILAFLLYNESLIRQLRQQEERNVTLYARLISLMPLAADEQSVAIFREISLNPTISFPVIITDYSGKVTHYSNLDGGPSPAGGAARRLWRRLAFWTPGARRAATDSTARLEARLAALIQRMDAANEPIPFYPVPQPAGRAYAVAGNVVITDADGWPVRWSGPDLPAAEDTTAAARARVEQFQRALPPTAEPLAFVSTAGYPGYLYWDGACMIAADHARRPVAWRGSGLPAPTDTGQAARAAVARQLQSMAARLRPVSLEIPAQSYIHYGPSRLVRRMSRATYVQILALLLFVLVALVGLRNIQRSQQRSIWIGMAKETAHQLGTPLSSLAGWLELLQARLADSVAAAGSGTTDPAVTARGLEALVGEMSRDMQRLRQIASRFSQIGSVAELHPGDIVAILEETASYFRARAPHFGRYEIVLTVSGPIPRVPLNADLLAWVFENLFKNAIDALGDRSGTIAIEVHAAAAPPAVRILFRDTGRGIAPENLRRVFDPGFSTKKRGWGLGLAFARRIVEEYHGGRIGILASAPGQGTTVEVQLPAARES